MTQSMLLPWFPILLAVGVAGRLVGRARGLGLGILCALFWIVLVQASEGIAVWQEPWKVASLVFGAAAILLMGGWTGGDSRLWPDPTQAEIAPTDSRNKKLEEFDRFLTEVNATLEQFEDWLEQNGHRTECWGDFGEFLRSALYRCCRATHVKIYRLVNQGAELHSLGEPGSMAESQHLSARRGIIGQVVATGRSYVAAGRSTARSTSDPDESPARAQLDPPAEQRSTWEPLTGPEDQGMAWCFSISRAGQRLGVVTVGRLGAASVFGEPLALLERTVSVLWCALTDATECRMATDADSVTGVLTRQAFLRESQRIVRDAFEHGEPVAMAVVAVQGLRHLNDSGHWELADELLREAGDLLRRQMRKDDCLGRFDGSRFIWLLRRVDSDLAFLIVNQLLRRLGLLCADASRWRSSLDVCCGLSGSSVDRPDLRALISQALCASNRARTEHLPIVSDGTERVEGGSRMERNGVASSPACRGGGGA